MSCKLRHDDEAGQFSAGLFVFQDAGLSTSCGPSRRYQALPLLNHVGKNLEGRENMALVAAVLATSCDSSRSKSKSSRRTQLWTGDKRQSGILVLERLTRTWQTSVHTQAEFYVSCDHAIMSDIHNGSMALRFTQGAATNDTDSSLHALISNMRLSTKAFYDKLLRVIFKDAFKEILRGIILGFQKAFTKNSGEATNLAGILAAVNHVQHERCCPKDSDEGLENFSPRIDAQFHAVSHYLTGMLHRTMGREGFVSSGSLHMAEKHRKHGQSCCLCPCCAKSRGLTR